MNNIVNKLDKIIHIMNLIGFSIFFILVSIFPFVLGITFLLEESQSLAWRIGLCILLFGMGIYFIIYMIREFLNYRLETTI